MAATVVDTFSVPSCFTTFPVYVHEDERDIARCEDTVPKIVHELAPHLDVRLHSIGPYGNVFAFCYPTGLTERVGLNAEIVEALWIYDDVIEALPYKEAAKLHDALYALLDGGISQPSVEQNRLMNMFLESWALALGYSEYIRPSDDQDWVLAMFQDFPSRVKALDPAGAPMVMDFIKTYIKEYDTIEANFTTVEEYVEFRRINAGFDLMEGFMRWDCDIHLNPTEVAASRDYGTAAGNAMALTNDYFSWDSEKGDSMGRQHNAVAVVMRLHGVGEEHAKTFVKGLVIEAEEKTRRLGLKLAKDASEEMKRYLDAMGYMLGGHLFWSATCPRYNLVSKAQGSKSGAI